MNPQQISAFAGKWVALKLRFTDGRERAIPSCKVMGAGGSTAFTVDGGDLMWPTTVRYSEVVEITEVQS